MADSTVSIGADLSQLRRDLAKLPNLSGDAAQATLVKLERVVQSAEKQAKKAAKAIGKSNKAAAKESEKAAEEAERALKGLYELSGGSGEQMEKLSAVLSALQNPAVLGAVAVTAVGTAAVGSVAGVVALVAAAEDLAEELEPLQEIEGFGVTPEQLASIHAANSALEGVVSIGKQGALTLGAEFAPAVEQAATVVLKLGLIGMDAFNAFAEGDSILRQVGGFMGDKLVKLILAPVSSLMRLIDTMGSLAGALGADEISAKLKQVSDDYDAFTRGVADSAVDFYFDAAAEGVQKLDKATGNYDARAQELIGTLTKIRTADKEAEKAAKDHAAALETAAKLVQGLTYDRMDDRLKLKQAEEEALAALLETEVATAEQIQILREEFSQRRLDLVATESQAAEDDYKRRVKLEQALTDAKARELDQQVKDQQKAQQDALGFAASAASSLGKLAGLVAENQIANSAKSAKARKKAAMVAYKAEKAAALATVAINTASAVLKGIATFGPPPSPLGIAAIASAALIGGTQAAAIAATPPPEFHIGGQVQGPRPGEVDVRAKAGEVYVPEEVADANGGPAEFLHKARAGGMGGVVSVDFKLRHRSMDRVNVEVMNAGGRTSKATRKLRSSGYSNPYARSA
jgi:uncharacterized protein YajQ (UPF0234 family)